MTTGVGGLGSRRVTADIAVQLIGRVLDLALGVVVTVALVRYLGDSDYGKWATIMSVTSFITVAGPRSLTDGWLKALTFDSEDGLLDAVRRGSVHSSEPVR